MQYLVKFSVCSHAYRNGLVLFQQSKGSLTSLWISHLLLNGLSLPNALRQHDWAACETKSASILILFRYCLRPKRKWTEYRRPIFGVWLWHAITIFYVLDKKTGSDFVWFFFSTSPLLVPRCPNSSLQQIRLFFMSFNWNDSSGLSSHSHRSLTLTHLQLIDLECHQ